MGACEDKANQCCDCCQWDCHDCEWCHKTPCPDCPGVDCCDAVWPLENPPCCGCAPECYLVPIAGVVTNGDRDCYDCCHLPGDPSINCPCENVPCGPPCDSCGNPACPHACDRSLNCYGNCLDNVACGFANGVYLIKTLGAGYCSWQVGGYKNEPADTPLTNCCQEKWKEWCECLSSPSCCKTSPCAPTPCPTLCVSDPDCPLYPSFNACIEELCRYDVVSSENKSHCGCQSAASYWVSSWIAEDDGFYTGECWLRWFVQISMGFLGTCTYDQTWSWFDQFDCTVFPDGINQVPCNSSLVFSPTTYWVYKNSTSALCDCPGTVSMVPFPCPPSPFWVTPKNLYFIKNNNKYINLTELKRRQWMKSVTDKAIKIADKLKEQSLNYTQEYLFDIVKNNENKKLLKTNLDLGHSVVVKIHERERQRFLGQNKKTNIRNLKEADDIYNNICKNCTYFDNDFCMLEGNNTKIKNILVDADTSCPDYPPRWSSSSNLEPISDPINRINKNNNKML